MTKILTTILYITLTAMCGQIQQLSATTNGTNPNWKTLVGEGYSIQYPPEWILDESGDYEAIFILLPPFDSDYDPNTESVGLFVFDLSGGDANLNTTVKELEKQRSLANSTILESKRIKHGSTEFHRMVYTEDLIIGFLYAEVIQVRYEWHLWEKDEKLYFLFLTCELDKFADFREIGEAILKSFTLR